MNAEVAFFELVWDDSNSLYKEVQLNCATFSDVLESKDFYEYQHISFFLIKYPTGCPEQIIDGVKLSLSKRAKDVRIKCLEPTDCSNCPELLQVVGEMLFSCRECYQECPQLQEARDQLYHEVMTKLITGNPITDDYVCDIYGRINALGGNELAADLGYYTGLFYLSDAAYEQIKQSHFCMPDIFTGIFRYEHSPQDFLYNLWHFKPPTQSFEDFKNNVKEQYPEINFTFDELESKIGSDVRKNEEGGIRGYGR